jgi:hypothetical protein
VWQWKATKNLIASEKKIYSWVIKKGFHHQIVGNWRF